jgi:hypothetical protein
MYFYNFYILKREGLGFSKFLLDYHILYSQCHENLKNSYFITLINADLQST